LLCAKLDPASTRTEPNKEKFLMNFNFVRMAILPSRLSASLIASSAA
jgi:hypothetical protein